MDKNSHISHRKADTYAKVIDKTLNKGGSFFRSLSLGLFLATRQIKRGSKGTTILIIFVMMLTFLNLVVVRGILVGLIQSSTNVYRTKYAGDIIISVLPKKEYIENSPSIVQIVKNLPWVEHYSARYSQGGSIEGTYKERVDLTDKPNIANANITGINVNDEELTTHLSKNIKEGSFLRPED